MYALTPCRLSSFGPRKKYVTLNFLLPRLVKAAKARDEHISQR